MSVVYRQFTGRGFIYWILKDNGKKAKLSVQQAIKLLNAGASFSVVGGNPE